VVCDAGGGTVDLVSYTVVKLEPVIEVNEAAPGTGALCGSTYLNRRFKDFLQSRLGQEKGWDDEVLQDAMNDFELVVRNRQAVYSAKTNLIVDRLNGIILQSQGTKNTLSGLQVSLPIKPLESEEAN
jgi:hypothetical protein